MGHYLFLDDGRRVDVEGGRIKLFPDDGFRFRDAIHLGDIERAPGGWALRRNGRDLGVAASRRAAVARLMEDAAEDIDAHELARQQEREAQAGAGDYVRTFLPDYTGDRVLPPYLVFSADELLELLDTVEESALHDEEEMEPEPDEGREADWRAELPEPTTADLVRLMREHLGLSLDDDPDEVAQLVAIEITHLVWRNSPIEDVHAGSHPRGGFPDTDMMRYNIATTRAVAEHVSAARIDWGGLHNVLVDPTRTLPGGLTVAQLAGDELIELLAHSSGLLWGLQRVELEPGSQLLRVDLALQAGLRCKDWYGTPWWPDVVDAFLDLLADPSSDAWKRDDGSSPEPPSVADRAALRTTLLERPEQLDDDGIWWCHGHGLAWDAPRRGFARWRRRREPGWEPDHGRSGAT